MRGPITYWLKRTDTTHDLSKWPRSDSCLYLGAIVRSMKKCNYCPMQTRIIISLVQRANSAFYNTWAQYFTTAFPLNHSKSSCYIGNFRCHSSLAYSLIALPTWPDDLTIRGCAEWSIFSFLNLVLHTGNMEGASTLNHSKQLFRLGFSLFCSLFAYNLVSVRAYWC